jgi:hypothetical protein
MKSTLFGAQIDARSPGSTPAAMTARVAASARSASSE